MEKIDSVLGNIYGSGHRPLQRFTKEQLFAYPMADPTEEAHWRFTHEVLARRGKEAKVKGFLKHTKDQTQKAERRVAMAPNAEDLVIRAKYLAFCKTQEAKAQAAADALRDDDQAVSHEEVQAFYKRRSMPAFQAFIDRYNKHDLFKAQGYGFLSFLTAKAEDRKQDETTWDVVLRLAAEVDEEKSAIFLEIRAMYISRILPSIATRRRFTTEEGNTTPIASLKDFLQKEYWHWWRNYYTATLVHDWMDDSGVAAVDEKLQEVRDQIAIRNIAA